MDLIVFYREFFSQIVFCVTIGLAASSGAMWPLFVGLAAVAWFSQYHDADIFSTITLTRFLVIEGWKNYGIARLALTLLCQFVGAIVGAWFSFLLVDDSTGAPSFAEGVTDVRAVVILLFTAFFHVYAYTFIESANTHRRAVTYGFLIAATFYLNQAQMPGATGTINLDFGRMIGAKMHDSNYQFETNHFLTFLFVPVGSVLLCFAHSILDQFLGGFAVEKASEEQPQV